MRFLLIYLLIALVLLAVLFAWNWRHFSMTAGLVMAALVIELLVFLRLRQRREREIEATRQFLEHAPYGRGPFGPPDPLPVGVVFGLPKII